MASNPRPSSIALRLLLYFALVVPGFISFPGISGAAMQITLAWDANSEPDLEGYRLYARQADRDYNYTSPACDGSDTSCTIYDLAETVEHCFVVRAYDADGNESSDSNEVCLPPNQADPADIDDDHDGFTENQGDCNDGDAGIHPGAAEVCGDGTDQNCDGIDPACPADIDDDHDGFTENQGDCNDGAAGIHPGAAEVCGDGTDQNCDGIDPACPADIDDDHDGFTENQGDCNDGAAGIHPGAAEVCGDGTDQNCDGIDPACPADIDDDHDGFTENQGDCNDGAAGIHPGAAEVCGDGIDQNCDGSDSTCANVVADAGPDQTVTAGDPVSLDGSNSHDPGGSIASYLWTQMSGPTVIMSGEDASNLNFIAPEFVSDENIFEFSLTVGGSDGSASTDTCVVIVAQKNQPPVADAGPDQKVAFNEEVALNGLNSTSSDDGGLTYSWKPTSDITLELSDPFAPSPTFLAPVAERALEFELTVTDANGLTSTDSCIVNVSIQNEPPTANAGADVVAASNQTVFLDGTGSLDDGQAVTYNWSQTEGPPVTLSDANSASPYFISPTAGAEGASLTFQLTVADQGGLKDTDSCIVNVTSQNQPPEAVTNEYVETTPDMVVTLDGTLSTDIDDGIESYRWHQLEGPPVTFDDPKAAQLKFSAPSSGPYGSNMLFALNVKDKGGLKKSAKCAVFVQPESSGPAKLTVLEPIISLFQKGSFYQAKASVFVFDITGGAVKDAAVKGRWSLPGLGEFAVSGYTSGAGEAKLDSERFKQPGTLYFKVTEISIGGEPITVNTETSKYVP